MGKPGRKKNPERTAATRKTLIEKSYELFSGKSIESVSMSEIAKASGFGDITVYRYFPSKPILVVEVAAWKWTQFREENIKRRPAADFDGMTSAEIFDFYLASFIELYKNHRDILRFNQFFNVYVQSEDVPKDMMKPYQDVIADLGRQFHGIYAKARKDHALRTDEPEEIMFSKTLHLMLAAVTRYAVGLVYIPEKGFDGTAELEFLKNAILREYSVADNK